MGLVGESGCGKSTLGRAVLQLIKPTAGSVYFEGADLTKLPPGQLRQRRANMQMIFQDPFSSLDPRFTVGRVVAEPLENFKFGTPKEVDDRVRYLLQVVGMSPNILNRYPHEFSGGQRQRIGIARALALNPKFIVADEPISALDVSIQAQVLNLLGDLQSEFNLTYLFMAHNLSAIKHISNRVAVMYLGQIVELGSGDDVYRESAAPLHHRAALGQPVPRSGHREDAQAHHLDRRRAQPGESAIGLPVPPALLARTVDLPRGAPRLEMKRPNHLAACHFPGAEG